MNAAARGGFLLMRGDSGSGKSTFLHTLSLFRENVEVASIPREADLPSTLRGMTRATYALRVLIVEEREALRDVSVEELEAVVGADALLGVGESVFRFSGPNRTQYLDIATRTIASCLAPFRHLHCCGTLPRPAFGSGPLRQFAGAKRQDDHARSRGRCDCPSGSPRTPACT